ncbi:hypothetical protein [Marinobacter sp.]|uniref:hypothetical protein n=1 Tax=Marinobacter sp. TaxID=50741 RepID=UPI00384ED3F1
MNMAGSDPGNFVTNVAGRVTPGFSQERYTDHQMENRLVEIFYRGAGKLWKNCDDGMLEECKSMQIQQSEKSGRGIATY